jgi:glycerol uptake facilitator protein
MNLSYFLGEFIGLFVFVVVHGGIMASIVFTGKAKDSFLPTFAVFAGITFGVYAAIAGGSDAHINPAVTMAFLATGAVDAVEAFTYILGQLLGGVVGAFTLYAIYRPQFVASKEPLAPLTGNPEKKDLVQNLITSLLGSFLLAFLVVVVVKETENTNDLTPVVVGAAVTAAAFAFGGTAYSVLNVARDLGPRVTATVLRLGKPEWVLILSLVAASLVGGFLAGFVTTIL